MIEGRCDCGALSWRASAPAFLSDCTCSFCRRSGALWGEVEPAVAVRDRGARAREYLRGERMLAFVFCAECGNLSHWRSQPGHGDRMKLNFRLAPPEALIALPRRTFDGADTWRYLD